MAVCTLSTPLAHRATAGLRTLAALVLLGGCGSYEGPSGDASRPRDGYPHGPYGAAAGAVLEDATFVTAEGQALSFGQIHLDPRNRLLLLTTSAGWCSACIEEQPKLQQLHERHGNRGLYVMVALFQNESFAPADAAFAARWKTDHGLTFTVVADADFTLAVYYPDPSATPVMMVVDLDTMTILRVSSGLDESALDAIIRAQL